MLAGQPSSSFLAFLATVELDGRIEDTFDVRGNDAPIRGGTAAPLTEFGQALDKQRRSFADFATHVFETFGI